MIKDINITPMTGIHIPAVAELEKICFSEPWSEQSLMAELENPNARFLTALCEDQPVGYAGMYAVMGEGYITNIAVHPKFRRRGIARLLVLRLLELVMDENMDFLTLEVRSSNAAAISLYESMGFEQVGHRKDFYRHPTEDALLMTVYPRKRTENYVC